MTEQTNARPQGTDIVRLTDLAAQLLGQAKAHPSQRAAQTIHSGSSMRATVIALAAGAELAEHESPPAATLQVISGQVRLHWGDQEALLRDGEITDIPPHRHALKSLTDAVVLLTVALH